MATSVFQLNEGSHKLRLNAF